MFNLDSDNAYSTTTTYPLMAKSDRDSTKDESSSSTFKASNDQLATSTILDKQHNSRCIGSGTTSAT